MSRVKKDSTVREGMCERLELLIDRVYCDSDAGMAERLGYANTSTLYRMRQRLAFPDVERLERLVASAPAPEVVVNLNWLIAGVGYPLLRMYEGKLVEEMTMGQFVDRVLATK